MKGNEMLVNPEDKYRKLNYEELTLEVAKRHNCGLLLTSGGFWDLLRNTGYSLRFWQQGRGWQVFYTDWDAEADVTVAADENPIRAICVAWLIYKDVQEASEK